MKLHEAVLCIDCDEVFVAGGVNPGCPNCGSRAYAPLSRWITSWEAYDAIPALAEQLRREQLQAHLRAMPVAAKVAFLPVRIGRKGG